MADEPEKKVDEETPETETPATEAAAAAPAEEAPAEVAEETVPEEEAKAAETATAAPDAADEPEAADAPTEEPVAEAPAPVDVEKPKTKRKPAAKKPAETPKPAPKRKRGDVAERVTVRAHAKYVRTSARKARLVADHVKGKDVAEARALLQFSPRSVAEDWRKLLESAIANAEHNHDLVGEDLKVLNATADEGPTLKRFRPRAMGRATRIRKRTSHLTITLTPKEN